MSKQESTIAKGAAKVASAIAKVFETVSKQGNIITQCVSSVTSVYKGKPVPSTDIAFIANNVARLRGWSKGSEGPRKSEVRKIVRNYTRIPEAMQKVGAADGNFTWHDAMRLLTALNAEPALGKAVLRFNAKGPVTKATSATPTKVLGQAVSKIMNLDTRAVKITKFQEALETLCDSHGIDW
jgi:hypothetical protein